MTKTDPQADSPPKASPDGARPAFDILIRGGTVLDGSGVAPFPADVGVRDGRIAGFGDLRDAKAARTISAEALYVTPGFVDMHTHSERGLPMPELAPSAHNLTQGVTTVVGGADGYGAWPDHETIEDQVDRLTKQGIGTNAVLLTGLGQARRHVMGLEDRAPSPPELARMKGFLRQAMEGGAGGVSSGLMFPPGQHFSTGDVIDLVKEVAPYGGIYHTHMRSEGDGLIEAVKETIRIAEESGALTVITHFKATYRRNWGKVRAATDLIEQARARGVEVYADQYPFTEGGDVSFVPPAAWHGSAEYEEQSATRLAEILGRLPEDSLIDLYAELAGLPALEPEHRLYLSGLPRTRLLQGMVSAALSRMMPAAGPSLLALHSWQGMQRGPGNPQERARFISRLADAGKAAEVRAQVDEHITTQLGGADNIVILHAARHELEDKTLREAARILGKTVTDAAIQLALEDVRAVVIMMSDDDVEHVMQRDYVVTGSDGDYPYFGSDVRVYGVAQIVRSYATFSTKIRKYVMARGVITLPHAIRSCTSLPATILGWRDRGLIREGFWADIAVFNPETIRPRSTLRDTHQYSEGMEYVLVNGGTGPGWREAHRPARGSRVEAAQ